MALSNIEGTGSKQAVARPYTQVSIFADPPGDLPPAHKQLFDDFGLEAYGIIFFQDLQDRQREDDDHWDRFSPIRGKEDDDDEELDLGPEEPDEY